MLYSKKLLPHEYSMPQVAKLSSKGQFTIPVEIRKILHLKAGDTLAWGIKSKGLITVRRVGPMAIDYLSALSGSLSAWNSVEDDKAYRDL